MWTIVTIMSSSRCSTKTASTNAALTMSLTREAALDIVALAAALLFAHGQTTERTIVAAERLGHALGVPVTALPYWGQLTVEIDGTTLSKIVPVKPLGVDMGKVLAVTTVVDQVCNGTLEADAARSALASAGRCRRFRRCGSRCWRPLARLRSASFSA